MGEIKLSRWSILVAELPVIIDLFVWDFPTLCQERRYFFLYLFVYESQVFVTWSLLGRERTLGMSVSVWRPLFVSGVVSWRIISTCFLGAINLQGKEKSPSLLTFFIVLSELCRL